MQILKKSFFLFLALLVTIGMASCSSDDDNKEAGPAGQGGSAIGSATFTMSGEVEGVKTGMAEFEQIIVESINLKTWTISIFDLTPQTFTLDITSFVTTENPSQPGVGSYPIGMDQNNPEANYFNASLSLIENENAAIFVDYETSIAGGGTLTITKSDNKEISGTFAFTADRYDDSMTNAGTVEVTGSFSVAP